MPQILQHNSILQTWKNLSFPEQMANIGSEVERAMNWKEKGNSKFSQKAFFRALELFDLTLQSVANTHNPETTSNLPKLTEISRSKEVFSDFFWGENQYHTTKKSWQKYFKQFNYLARKNI